MRWFEIKDKKKTWVVIKVHLLKISFAACLLQVFCNSALVTSTNQAECSNTSSGQNFILFWMVLMITLVIPTLVLIFFEDIKI